MIDHYDVFYIGGSTGYAEFGWTQRELIDWARGNLDHPVRVYTQNGHLKWTYAA